MLIDASVLQSVPNKTRNKLSLICKLIALEFTEINDIQVIKVDRGCPNKYVLTLKLISDELSINNICIVLSGNKALSHMTPDMITRKFRGAYKSFLKDNLININNQLNIK